MRKKAHPKWLQLYDSIYITSLKWKIIEMGNKLIVSRVRKGVYVWVDKKEMDVLQKNNTKAFCGDGIVSQILWWIHEPTHMIKV